MYETLTVESLARSIHADELACVIKFGLRVESPNRPAVAYPFDDLSEQWKQCRREQARLLLARWMR